MSALIAAAMVGKGEEPGGRVFGRGSLSLTLRRLLRGCAFSLALGSAPRAKEKFGARGGGARARVTWCGSLQGFCKAASFGIAMGAVGEDGKAWAASRMGEPGQVEVKKGEGVYVGCLWVPYDILTRAGFTGQYNLHGIILPQAPCTPAAPPLLCTLHRVSPQSSLVLPAEHRRFC